MFQISVQNRTININESMYQIEAVLAYGMEECHAYHLLFLLEDCMNSRLLAIRSQLSKQLGIKKEQIVVMTKCQFASQAKKGDLFIWYLRSTCRVLFTKGTFIKGVFGSQIPKPNINFEMKSASQFVENAMQLYRNNRIDAYTMLAILADGIGEIGEHVCMKNGSVIFHKRNAVEKCFHFSNLTVPFTYQQYLVLYRYYCSYKEGCKLPRLLLVKMAVDEWYCVFCNFAKM